MIPIHEKGHFYGRQPQIFRLIHEKGLLRGRQHLMAGRAEAFRSVCPYRVASDSAEKPLP